MTTSVEILRDRSGIPHVYAERTTAVYFGLGYAMAEDRLWQMDWLRRRALGRQAEVLGPACVASDLMHRTVGIPEIAEREVNLVDASTRELLESFVGGINRYIDQCGSDLPVEFKLLDYAPQPFSVRDCVAILRGEFWSLNGRLHTLAIAEAARLLPQELREAYLTPESPETRILPPDAEYPRATNPLRNGHANGMGDSSGSNNWAVSGQRTKSGHALLCSDPHQPFWVPSSWYEYAVHGPEDDAAGAGHPGVPGLWWGSNATIAWGITNNAASTRDLYREEVHPDDASLYRDGDTWRRFGERSVDIAVRGESPVQHVVRSTLRGPIVNRIVPTIDASDNAPLALRWVGQEHLDDMRAVIGIARARSWQAFREALRDWAVPTLNFGYADASGHVGFQCAGRVPIRGRVASGYRHANQADDQWQGYIPFDGLPSKFEPARGYVASANERVAPDDYPYPMYGTWGSGYRAERLHQALGSAAAIDRDSAIALQNDVKNVRAERLCPPLVGWLERSDDPHVGLLCDVLRRWDYRYTRDSVVPTLFETFMETWQERVLSERFPAPLHGVLHGQTAAAARLIERGDVPWFAGDLREAICAVAADAISRVHARYGGDRSTWRWGSIHQAHWQHPLSTPERRDMDIGPAPVGGGAETLCNTGVGQPGFGAVGGVEYRLVVDFADPQHFLAVQNIGNSGRPESPHYRDQFEDWLAGRYHTVSLRREDVERDLESTLRLETAPVRVS